MGRLDKLNLLSKLRKFEKNMQHKMRELQSGKYSNMESSKRLEQWRKAKSHKWEKIARDAEKKFKHEETKEKRFTAALRHARTRLARMLRDVARGLNKLNTHKTTTIETGHNLRVKKMLAVKERTALQGLIKLRVNYLRKLHEMKRDRLRLLGILSQKKLRTSRMLEHAVEEKIHLLKAGSTRRKRRRGSLALLYAQLKEQKHEVKTGLRKMRLQGGLHFRKMISDQRHALNRAAVKETNLAFKLRHVWLKLHKALKLCKRKLAAFEACEIRANADNRGTRAGEKTPDQFG